MKFLFVLPLIFFIILAFFLWKGLSLQTNYVLPPRVNKLPPAIVFSFAEQEKQAKFEAITKVLRCLVCQNEAIADSQSTFAKDIRHEIYQKIEQGEEDKKILQDLTNRYGEFILYDPPFQKNTILLWIFPFVALCVGFFILFLTTRKRS